MSEPSTENKVASTVNSVLKELIEGAGVDTVEASLIAAYPWLGLPIVKQIFELILGEAGKLFYTQAADAATKVIIDIQVNLEEGSANSAFQNLLAADASGDQAAIEKASKDLSAAYGRIIHYDGSASV